METNIAKYILVSSKKWHANMLNVLKSQIYGEWIFIENELEFTKEILQSINPNKIFITHWSKIIPANIYQEWECIVFHMTDLPYGRGGSPLQNLIVAGHKDTVITAIKASKEIDAGPIYLKKPLSLLGSAKEIFERSIPIIQRMISEIIEENITPRNQEGEVTIFKRRNPNQSDISSLTELETVYNYIRMLDAETYPKAYLETETLRFEFESAKFDNDKLTANVTIIKK